MKKLYLLVIALFALAVGAKAQNSVVLHGSLDTAIAGKTVYINYAGGPGSGCSSSATTTTNSAGQYSYTLNVGSCLYGFAYVSTVDCGNDTLTQVGQVDSMVFGDSILFNFKYCDTGCYGFNAGFLPSANPFTKTVGFYSYTGHLHTWYFGDGNTSNLASPMHTYASSGFYSVAHRATDTVRGCTDSIITGMYFPPVDSIYVQGQLDSPLNNKPVVVSQYPGSFSWWNQTFYTNSSGQYGGWFRVVDSIGTIHATTPDCRGDSTYGDAGHTHFGDTVVINLAYCPPVDSCKNFKALYYYSVSGKTVTFSNGSSASANKYRWNFGNGSTSSAKNPAHTYIKDSSYLVCLIAEDTVKGCSDTICHVVVINTKSIIYGRVNLDSTTAQIDSNRCRIWLIKADSVGTDVLLTAIDSVLLSDTGTYWFEVVNGNYLIKAALLNNSVHYANYVPTYYVQSGIWSSATQVSVTTSSSMHWAPVTLIKGTNPGGPGFIGGYVSAGANKTGDPIEKVEVQLLTAAGVPVASAFTDMNGEYRFTGIALGNYRVRVEILGKGSEEYLVTLDQNNHNANNRSFAVNTKDIKINATNVGIAPVETGMLALYPNPAQNVLNIALANGEAIDEIKIYSILGEVVLQTAGHKDILDIGNLPNGVYSIITRSGDNYYSSRFAVNK